MYCNPFAGASCWASHLNFFGILRHQDAHAYRPQKPLKKLMGGEVSIAETASVPEGQTPPTIK
jgi:hypothetical protein